MNTSGVLAVLCLCSLEVCCGWREQGWRGWWRGLQPLILLCGHFKSLPAMWGQLFPLVLGDITLLFNFVCISASPLVGDLKTSPSQVISKRERSSTASVGIKCQTTFVFLHPVYNRTGKIKVSINTTTVRNFLQSMRRETGRGVKVAADLGVC